MHFSCRTFIGAPSSEFWSQYWENEPDDFSLVTKRGHLFGLISLQQPSSSSDLKKIGRQIIEDLDSVYFSDNQLDLSIPLALTQSLNQTLSTHQDQSYQISLQICVIYKSTAYFIIYNSGQISLCRSLQVSSLVNNSQISDLEVISGPVQNGDKILLSTQAFVDKISWNQIKNTLVEEKIQTIEEDFLSRLYSQDDQTRLAAALIQVHTDDSDNLVTKTFADPVVSQPEIPVYPSSPRSFNLPSKTAFFGKIKNIISQVSQPRPLYASSPASPQAEKRKKINLIIAIVLLVALTLSSIYAFQKNQAEQKETLYQTTKLELQSKIKEAQTIKNLDLNSAQEFANEAQKILDEMKKLELYPQETDTFQIEIDNLLSQTGSAKSFTPESFYNTTIINKQAKYRRLYLSDTILYLLDIENHRLDSLDITNKSTKSITQDKDLSKVLYFAKDQDNYFFISSNTLYQLTENKLISKVDLADISPGLSVSDFAFWNSSAYILDSANNTIWRLPPSASGFSTPTKWLKDNQTLPYNPVSLAINGKIWILSQSGQIVPYLQGIKNDYDNPLSESFSSANHLVTTLETDILAFSTADNQIFILSKQGQSLAKYNFDKLQISDLAIDEEGNRLFVLCSDQNIYQVSY